MRPATRRCLRRKDAPAIGIWNFVASGVLIDDRGVASRLGVLGRVHRELVLGRGSGALRLLCGRERRGRRVAPAGDAAQPRGAPQHHRRGAHGDRGQRRVAQRTHRGAARASWRFSESTALLTKWEASVWRACCCSAPRCLPRARRRTATWRKPSRLSRRRCRRPASWSSARRVPNALSAPHSTLHTTQRSTRGRSAEPVWPGIQRALNQRLLVNAPRCVQLQP